MRKLYFILVILGIVASAHSDIFAQRKTQPRKVTPRTQPAKAPQKPNKSPYQNLAWQSEWGPWTPYYGYPGLLMRSKLMQTMQPAGLPWYNWEVELKNTYTDQIGVDIFTGDKDKFKNPAIREPYSDGSVHTIGPGKTVGTSGLRGTKSDVQVYVNLSFANTPHFNFPDGTTGSKIALHSNGAIPPYCKAYNKPHCPNYKEEEIKDVTEKEIVKKAEKEKEDIKSHKLTATELKQKIVELFKTNSVDDNYVPERTDEAGRKFAVSGVQISGNETAIKIKWKETSGIYYSLFDVTVPWEYFTTPEKDGEYYFLKRFIESFDILDNNLGAQVIENFSDGRVARKIAYSVSFIRKNQSGKNPEFSRQVEVLFKQLAQTMNEK